MLLSRRDAVPEPAHLAEEEAPPRTPGARRRRGRVGAARGAAPAEPDAAAAAVLERAGRPALRRSAGEADEGRSPRHQRHAGPVRRRRRAAARSGRRVVALGPGAAVRDEARRLVDRQHSRLPVPRSRQPLPRLDAQLRAEGRRQRRHPAAAAGGREDRPDRVQREPAAQALGLGRRLVVSGGDLLPGGRSRKGAGTDRLRAAGCEGDDQRVPPRRRLAAHPRRPRRPVRARAGGSARLGLAPYAPRRPDVAGAVEEPHRDAGPACVPACGPATSTAVSAACWGGRCGRRRGRRRRRS